MILQDCLQHDVSLAIVDEFAMRSLLISILDLFGTQAHPSLDRWFLKVLILCADDSAARRYADLISRCSDTTSAFLNQQDIIWPSADAWREAYSDFRVLILSPNTLDHLMKQKWLCVEDVTHFLVIRYFPGSVLSFGLNQFFEYQNASGNVVCF